ncbi:Flp family type IVb pilin [Brevundimonas sp.]|jgi:pilus assembly protein Flp/PilA|uniref:Flp family type IVb pilin n=1 Tax=Brevundimonas sp. TaxID=1871086 RepID=UPI002ABC5E7A|nr:Flp family type IVb pilin [Brevundimonas sp.]MDZ4365192.1 Flp family type IVb pilin [Brevundimonas sp.]
MRRLIARFVQDRSGATALEYGIIMALMFLVMLGALSAFGGTGSGIFTRAMDAIREGMGG